MPAPSPRLAYAYRILADTALTIGAIALILAIGLHLAGAGNGLPLIATAILAGLVGAASSIQHARYRGDRHEH